MGMAYRSDEEVAAWKKRDPIELLEQRMAQLGVMSPEEARRVHERVKAEAAEAIAFAEASPFPTPEQMTEDVYFVS
jgi:pyruvate dehydrogenase E1 component alpha subunit